jgi:hypothetical protein
MHRARKPLNEAADELEASFHERRGAVRYSPYRGSLETHWEIAVTSEGRRATAPRAGRGTSRCRSLPVRREGGCTP